MKKLENVNTVLLDIDDTIMDFGKAQKYAFFSAMEEANIPCDEALYRDYDSINIKYWKAFERGEIEKNRLIYARFIDLFSKHGMDCDPVAVEKSYQWHLGERYFFIDGAEEGVKYLKSKYSVYIVTNGLKITQERKIKLSGLDKITDGVFISETIGKGKPSAEYFDYVFSVTSAEREKTIIIGDSLTSDILGGINAGIRTVWFNGKGKVAPENIRPDYIVGSWNELLKLL